VDQVLKIPGKPFFDTLLIFYKSDIFQTSILNLLASSVQVPSLLSQFNSQNMLHSLFVSGKSDPLFYKALKHLYMKLTESDSVSGTLDLAERLAALSKKE
jgi:hypothetical protein